MDSFERFKGLNFTQLDAYKREGKLLKGAFADLPNMRNRSWINEALPELMWVVLMRNRMTLNSFTDAYKQLAMQLVRLGASDISLTSLGGLSGFQRELVIPAIASSPFMRKTLRPLLLFGDELPGYTIWKQAIGMPADYVNDAAILAETIAATLDHQSQEATDCRWARVLPMMLAQKVHLPPTLGYELLDYPNVLDMRHTRPAIRALEISFSINPSANNTDNNVPSAWSGIFWSICFTSTRCLIPSPNPLINDFSASDYEDFIAYHRKKVAGLRLLHERHLPNIRLDVLTGAALYSMKILEELTKSPATSGIIGRITARTLTEVAINVTYLTEMGRNNPELWEAFYFHGQGEAKKIFLKYQRARRHPAFIEPADIWLIANETRFMDFLNIKLGDWDDENLRRRAEAVDLKSFYDNYYDWPSNYTHGTWAALRREVYTPCQNPLHKFHLLPASESPNDYGSVLAESLEMVRLILSNLYEEYPELEIHKFIEATSRVLD